MLKVKNFFKRFYLALLLLFLYLPIVTLMVFSFNSGDSMAKWEGFSFNWYVEMVNDPTLMEALWVTNKHRDFVFFNSCRIRNAGCDRLSAIIKRYQKES